MTHDYAQWEFVCPCPHPCLRTCVPAMALNPVHSELLQ